MNHQGDEGLAFGRLLKALRQQKTDLTQRGLAMEIKKRGVSCSGGSVSGWEENKRLPNSKERRKIVLIISEVLRLGVRDANLLLNAARLSSLTSEEISQLSQAAERSQEVWVRRLPPSVRPLPISDKSVSEIDQQSQEERAWQAARSEYLKVMCIRYDFLAFPLGPSEGLSLQAVFQPLILRRDPLAVHEQKGPVIAENGEDALQKSHQGRIVVLGGPGTGKTTVLRYLMYTHAQLARTDLTAPLPIFITLPELADKRLSLREYFQRLEREIGIAEQSSDLLWQAVKNGNAFVCLDSLDEVSPTQRPTIIERINEQAVEPGNVWVVGSRFAEYKGGQFARGQFTEWELQPLDDTLRKQLARRLIPVLWRLLSPQEQRERSAGKPLAFVKALQGHSRAMTWGENPLLFCLAAAIYVETGTLPSSRAALYQQVVDAVLRTREPSLTRWRMLRQVLAVLALELYQARERTFTHDDLLLLLPKIRKRQDENWLTDEMADRIISSGILDVVADEVYAFRHQTFQEYFVAAELARCLMSQDQAVREQAWNVAWRKRTRSRWTEILCLMVGVLVQDYGEYGVLTAQRWLSSLLEQRRTQEGDPGGLGVILALKSLGEVAGINNPYWTSARRGEMEQEIVVARIESLCGSERVNSGIYELRQQERRIDEFVSDITLLGKEIMPLVEERLWAVRDRHQDTATAVLSKLGLLGKEQKDESAGASPATPLINNDTRADQTLEDGLRELGAHVSLQAFTVISETEEEDQDSSAHIMRELEEQTSIESLLVLLEDRSKDADIRSAAVRALGKRGERVPVENVLTLLNDHEDEKVRHAAETVLASLGKYAPNEQLLKLLREQENIHGRWSATSVLKRLGEYAPIEDLLTLLHEEDTWVSWSAARILGNLGKHTPIERLLALLSNKNEKAGVRQAAAKALGEHGAYVSSEQFLAFLDDDDVEVRRTIVEELWREEHIPIERLKRCLYDTDIGIRGKALDILNRHGVSLPPTFLLAALRSDNRPTQSMITQREASVDVQALIEPLVAAWNRGEGDQRNELATHVLENLGTGASVELLLAALNSTVKQRAYGARLPGQQHLSAMRILEHLGAYDQLAALLLDPGNLDELARRAAIQVLGYLGEQAPGELLELSLEDQDAGVRRVAVQALGRLRERVPIEQLLALLDNKDEDVGVRRTVVEVLGKLGEHTPVDRLLIAVNDDNPSIRSAAVAALGELGEHAPIEPVLVALNDTDLFVRSAAAETLEELEAYLSIEVLLPLLANKDWHTRRAAVKILIRSGNRMPTEVLSSILNSDDVEILQDAQWVLASTWMHKPIESLIVALQSKHQEIRLAALQDLRYLEVDTSQREPIVALEDEDGQVSSAAVERLKKRDERIPVNLLLTAWHDEDVQVRLAAAQVWCALGVSVSVGPLLHIALHNEEHDLREEARQLLPIPCKDVSAPSLVTLMKSDNIRLRVAAIELLGHLRAYAWRDALILALYDEHQEIGRAAAEALGKMGPYIPVTRLKVAALYDKAAMVRKAAIRALGQLGEKVPVEPFLVALRDTSPGIRQTAVQVLLWQMREHAPVEPLLAALYDEERTVYTENGGYNIWHIRAMVVEGLGLLGPHVPVKHLIAVLGDSREEVREAAATTLQRIHPEALLSVMPEVISILERRGTDQVLGSVVQSHLAILIGNIGYNSPLLRDKLEDLLNWPYWEVRMEAARALGQLRLHISETALRRLYDLRHDLLSPAVREAADDALSEILLWDTIGIEDDEMIELA